MNKNILIVFGVVVLVAAGWFLFKGNYANGPTSVDDAEDADGGVVTDEMPVPGEGDVDDVVVGEDEAGGTSGTVVTYTDDGFSPAELTVAAGTEVTFVNSSSRDFWPASAIHPTHKVYPGSGIEKCGTEDEAGIFDACRNIAPGGSYVFAFSEVGTWNYHDHLMTSEFGKIIVQ